MLKRQLFVIFLFYSRLLFAVSSEDLAVRQIQAHFVLKDFPAACSAVNQARLCYPESKIIHQTLISALAKNGCEKRMLQEWSLYLEKYPEESQNRALVEDIAWGVILKAADSQSIIMRQMALLAAFYSQDSRGVQILHHALNDSNQAIRAVAAKFASSYRDYQLINEIKRLYKVETSWVVRKQVIEAIGSMKIVELQPELEKLISSDSASSEEKAIAICSLVSLLETINRKEAELLAKSSRNGLKQLVCQAIAHFQSERDVDLLLILTSDTNSDVRKDAFQALSLIQSKDLAESIKQAAQKGILDINPYVGISAARLLMLYDPQEAICAFDRYLYHSRRDVCLLAASALASTGLAGSSHASKTFYAHSDPFVRLNLALGLIGLRENTSDMTVFIRQLSNEDNSKWQQTQCGLFTAITNYWGGSQKDGMLDDETESQLIRLKILNILAMLKDPYAEEAVRAYLQQRSWKMTAAASALLLTECDESSLVIVKSLLKDKQPRIRLQSALLLSIWGKDEDAIEVLKTQYPISSWENKVKILEGFGKIGSMKVIPFFLDTIQDPSQTLRLVSAVGLIECLNQ